MQRNELARQLAYLDALRAKVHSLTAPERPTLATPYLTVAEAAAYLRTTSKAIYHLVERGLLEPLPGPSRRVRFTRAILDAYMKGQ